MSTPPPASAFVPAAPGVRAKDGAGGAGNPVVTVLIVTYNHARYIADAVDSALNQHTPFPVEILISEDASTDGTREIVLGYAERHPDRIRLLLSAANLRSNEVVARGIRAARGRYLALLDGDDRWVGDDKLARQAAYLEAHPQCSAVFFNAVIAENEKITDRRWTPPDLAPQTDLAGIWGGNPFAICAGMIRMAAVADPPVWYGSFLLTDWPLYILAARTGTLDFRDHVCSAYRHHDAGQFSALSHRARQDAIYAFYRRMLALGEPDLSEGARRGGSRYFLEWAEAFLERGDKGPAWSAYCRALRLWGVPLRAPPARALGLGLRLVRSSMGAP
jgi:glycosyltransferase involved in cell wall biosynthesis